MKSAIVINYSRLKVLIFLFPLFFIVALVLFLYSKNSLNINGYIQIQENSFFYINRYLGKFTAIEFNITQLGDVFIILSILSVFIINYPKIWQTLILSLLTSLMFCNPLKSLFKVPRPPAFFSDDSFIVIGKALCARNSTPSGHSTTIFTVLTVLLFAFMPRKFNYKVLWYFFIIAIALFIAFSRVAVGAHYPLDVLIGGALGYISGLTGIFISRKLDFKFWITPKRYYFICMFLLIAAGVIIIGKIFNKNLAVYYLAFFSLAASLYKITISYVKK